MKCVAIKVYGKVQGVFFRDSARKLADSLGVAGFVRNEPDGSVYAETEGSDDAVAQFVEWCHEGPAGASVESVDAQDLPLRHFDDFSIRH